MKTVDCEKNGRIERITLNRLDVMNAIWGYGIEPGPKNCQISTGDLPVPFH